MTTKSGSGYSNNTNSKEAGLEAAKQALAQAGGRCDVAMLFCTSKHDPALLRDAVRAVIGLKARLVGGYTVGVITHDKLSYMGAEVGVAVINSDTVKVDLFSQKGLKESEEDTGAKLAKQILATEFRGEPNLILLYDSVKRAAQHGLALNMATPLLKGMSTALKTWPPTAGMGMIGDLQFNPTHQFFDDQVTDQSAMAMVLSGGVRMDTVILHGCKPYGTYHTITRAEGPVVLEIDGKPALELITEILGPGSEKNWEDFPLYITLGVNKGDKFGPYREEDYAARLCMAIDKERKGLVMFENDLTQGTEVQLMRRSLDFDYIGSQVKDLFGKAKDRKPFFALYIDCAGRGATFCGTDGEEGAAVQKAIGTSVPLLGVYSGVEVARFGNQVQALDWTGVLCLFSE